MPSHWGPLFSALGRWLDLLCKERVVRERALPKPLILVPGLPLGSPALPPLWLSVPRNTMEALPACLLQDVIQDAQGVAVIGIDEGPVCKLTCPDIALL